MIENFLNIFSNDWVLDAVVDSLKTLPFLFCVFLFIEIFEHFFANKVKSFLKYSKKEGPIIGAVASSVPQCGFSVIASTLYTEGLITKGTIIAVFLATSDEAIPVLLMYPEFFKYVFPLIFIKLLIAIPVGYLIDYLTKSTKLTPKKPKDDEHIEGCHNHEITIHKKRGFIFHPIKHTLSVFVFILILTLLLNYLIEVVDITRFFKAQFAFLTPLIAAIFGLIPNCAISVGLVLMFIKGTISFGAMVSGLLTSSGIGLLILLKNDESKRDTAFILATLVFVGYISGLLVQVFLDNFKVETLESISLLSCLTSHFAA